MENIQSSRFSGTCQKVIEGLILFLLVFTPLAFGARETWAITIMECISFLALATWLVKMTCEKELVFTKLLFLIPLAIALSLILLQLLPLPARFLGLVSPGTFHLYKEAIPDWPEGIPFNTIETTASELGIYLPSHEPPSITQTLSLYPFDTKIELLKFLTYLSIFFIVINNFVDQKALKRLTMANIFMGLFLAIFALIQYFTWNGKIYWFREQYWLRGEARGFSFPFGPFTNRNHFAGYMEMIIPLTLGQLVAGLLQIEASGKKAPFKERVFTYFSRDIAIVTFLYSAIIIMMLSLFFTLSRGGIIALLVSIIIFTILMPKKKRLIPVFVILGVVFVLGISQEMVIARLLHLGSVGRYDFWRDSLGAIRDFPIFGTGLGTFPWIFWRYQSANIEFFVDYAHNDYIQLFVEMGLMGFLTALSLCILYFIQTISLLRIRKDPYTKAVTHGGIASLGAIFTHSMVDFNLQIPSNALLATLIAALTLSVAGNYQREGKTKGLFHFWRLSLKNKQWAVITSFGLTGLLLIFLLLQPIKHSLASAYYVIREQHTNLSLQVVQLQRASHLEPLNSDYPRALSECYIKDGQREFALPLLIRAVCLKPTDPFLHVRLAALLDSFFTLREVPPNYAPLERILMHQIRASIALFPMDPGINAESAKLLLKRWNFLNETQKAETLSLVRKVIDFGVGSYSEDTIKALWEATGDISLLKGIVQEAKLQKEGLNILVERLENSSKDTRRD
ncbi:MAG TPA: O-antigen ligase family protein [Candidatus Tripitaka sp. YC43]